MSDFRIDYDQAAAAYARNRQIHPEVLRTLIEVGGIKAETAVLEVGCGTGNYLLALTEATGCRGWGVDPSQGMLDRAQARSQTISFQTGRAEALDFPADHFDLVYSVDVIHHVQDRAAYYQEAFRILRPDGQVCTVTDSAEIIRRRQPLSVYFPETVDVELKRYPRLNILRELMSTAGFDQIEEMTVELAYPLTDLQPYQEKAFSSLHLISEDAFQRGLNKMTTDLQHGPLSGLSAYSLLWGSKVKPNADDRSSQRHGTS